MHASFRSKSFWFNVIGLAIVTVLVLADQLRIAASLSLLNALANIVFSYVAPASQEDQPTLADLKPAPTDSGIVGMASGIAKLGRATLAARAQLHELGIESYNDRELAEYTAQIRAATYTDAARFLLELESIDPSPLIFASQEFYTRAAALIRPPASPEHDSRWESLDRTTNSGKRLFRCKICGRESPTPDKRCNLISGYRPCAEIWAAEGCGPWTRTVDGYICWSHMFCFPASDDLELAAWLLQHQPAAEGWAWIYSRDPRSGDAGADIIADIRACLKWPAGAPAPAGPPDPEVAHDA